MIIITDGKNKFELDENLLLKSERGYIINSPFDYWNTELLIEEKKNKFVNIIKKLPDIGDELQYFRILKCTKNNEILLNVDDYIEVKTFYDNLSSPPEIRKNAILTAVSQLFAYECYQTYYLERIPYDLDDMFNELQLCMPKYYDSTITRKEIIQQAKIILKEQYGVNLNSELEEED